MKVLRLVSIVSLVLNLTNAYSQPEVDVKKLELTTSPAYVLLGVQPTNIIRPSTPRDFATGLHYLNINGVVQPGFALEVNPFNWMKQDTDENTNLFLADDYFDQRIWPAIKKNLSISLATSATDTTVFGSLEKGTGLGFGIRATIIPGTVHKPTYDNFYLWALSEIKQTFLKNLKSLIRNIGDEQDPNSYIPRAMDMAEVALQERKDIPEGMKARIVKELEFYTKNFSQYTRKSDLDRTIGMEQIQVFEQDSTAAAKIDRIATPFAREGFILEVAYSGLFVMQDNKWDNTIYAKSGVWITPSYRLDLSNDRKPKLIQSLDFLAIVRYLWNEERVDSGNYADLGMKMQFNRNKWNGSVEGVARHASNVPEEISSNWTYTWIFNFSYLITQDISFKFSFGSNFDGNTTSYGEPNGVIVTGGLNFGILN